MSLVKKTAFEVRAEARDLAVEYMKERAACGDPEGAECMRDLAHLIHAIQLHKGDGK